MSFFAPNILKRAISLLRRRFAAPVLLCALFGFNSCVLVPQQTGVQQPLNRPIEFAEIYPEDYRYSVTDVVTIKERSRFKVQRFDLATAVGDVTVDYYSSTSPSPILIFVFPILKGRNLVSEHLAEYLVAHGFEAALIHRHDGFKDSESFDQIEQVLRDTIQRDRTVITFFEERFNKSRFGGFGISRGAINLTMTAGVDPRLEYLVLGMGGADIPEIYSLSDSGHVGRYRRAVQRKKGLSQEGFLNLFKSKTTTDPATVGRHIEADNVLMFLALFDTTVPLANGLKLRDALGRPDTIYLLSGHYSSVLYTQVIPLVLPLRGLRVLPLDIVEQEALSFFRKKFGVAKPEVTPTLALHRLMRFPFDFAAGVYMYLSGE
jgi:hypothetical protein